MPHPPLEWGTVLVTLLLLVMVLRAPPAPTPSHNMRVDLVEELGSQAIGHGHLANAAGEQISEQRITATVDWQNPRPRRPGAHHRRPTGPLLLCR
ncbi:MAG: hypothetical protein U1U88_001512 [Lawsonella clevelandensis]